MQSADLSGVELIRKKVRLVEVMAGAFEPIDGNDHFLEANVRNGIGAMQRFADKWPEDVPVIWSGFEIGIAVRFPARKHCSRLRLHESPHRSRSLPASQRPQSRSTVLGFDERVACRPTQTAIILVSRNPVASKSKMMAMCISRQQSVVATAT